MRKLRMVICAVCLLQALSAATVQFTVTPLGTNTYRDTYTVSGFNFQQNQELDIYFDPALYSNLVNAQSPAGYDVVLFQPNNPPGASGDYSALALVNNAASGPFSVDFTFTGTGSPGSQAFTISNSDVNGNLTTITSGQTTMPSSGVPEPATLSLAAVGGALMLAARRRSLS